MYATKLHSDPQAHLLPQASVALNIRQSSNPPMAKNFNFELPQQTTTHNNLTSFNPADYILSAALPDTDLEQLAQQQNSRFDPSSHIPTIYSTGMDPAPLIQSSIFFNPCSHIPAFGLSSDE